MDLKALVSTFVLVFLAELGDKTQLATLSFAAESKSKLAVFIGSACALVFTSLLAVLFGGFVSRFVPGNLIKLCAGSLFIILGLWMILSYWLNTG